MKREEAEALLKVFERLLPRGSLVLVKADGRHFAETQTWPLASHLTDRKTPTRAQTDSLF